MSWKNCASCSGQKVEKNDEISSRNQTVQKLTNYHEYAPNRQFRISIVQKCDQENSSINDALESNKKEFGLTTEFYVDVQELKKMSPFFENYENSGYIEFSTNCTSSSVSHPKNTDKSECNCQNDHSVPLIPEHFHAFLEATCPSIYGIRPVPLTLDNIIPILDMISHFPCEPLLTNCERILMSTNLSALEPIQLIRLLQKGMRVSLDHKILSRILCICLMNTSKLADISQELTGSVGALFAQAFIANSVKSFRHIKPLEQDLFGLNQHSGRGAENQENRNQKESDESKKMKKKGCDHDEESFECILCFDVRCHKCKGETSYCYKALDNFLYEVRLQLYPFTYRNHLDRELQRDDCINHYILKHQLKPIPNQL